MIGWKHPQPFGCLPMPCNPFSRRHGTSHYDLSRLPRVGDIIASNVRKLQVFFYTLLTIVVLVVVWVALF